MWRTTTRGLSTCLCVGEWVIGFDAIKRPHGYSTTCLPGVQECGLSPWGVGGRQENNVNGVNFPNSTLVVGQFRTLGFTRRGQVNYINDRWGRDPGNVVKDGNRVAFSNDSGRKTSACKTDRSQINLHCAFVGFRIFRST